MTQRIINEVSFIQIGNIDFFDVAQEDEEVAASLAKKICDTYNTEQSTIEIKDMRHADISHVKPHTS